MRRTQRGNCGPLFLPNGGDDLVLRSPAPPIVIILICRTRRPGMTDGVGELTAREANAYVRATGGERRASRSIQLAF